MNVNLIKKLLQNSKKCNNIICKILYQNVLCNGRNARHSSTLITTYKKPLIGYNVSAEVRPSKRSYCEEKEEEKEKAAKPAHKLPPLMDFPMVVWPSIFKSLKNLILTTLIIKPYFDAEFNLQEFVTGSKKAAEVVSYRISEGKDLDGLVSSDIIPKLQEKVSKMTLGQRDLIPIYAGDIYFSFPYQIGIMFNEEGSKAQKRFVEITMVYHVMKGLTQMRTRGEEPPLNSGLLPEYQDRMSICNYRFIKEFTKGVESDWTINLLNHFRPVDEES